MNLVLQRDVPAPARPTSMPSRVSAVIPAQNESARIAEVIAQLRRQLPDLGELIVVDDGSRDGTDAVAEAAGATVLRHPVARGYGAAIKTGICASRGEFVLTVDGDAQHRISDIPPLLAKAIDHDLVAGQRTHWFHSTAWRLPGKWLLKQLCSYLVRRPIPDLNCGLRVYRREVIARYLPLCSDAYSFTATSLVMLLYWGHRVTFIPVHVAPVSSQGRVTLRTGLDTFMLLLRMATLLDPLRVFLPLSGAVCLIGMAWGIPYALDGAGVSVGALLLLLTGVLLFAVGLLSDQIAHLRKEQLARSSS